MKEGKENKKKAKKEFGERLRKLRMKKYPTQEEFAVAAECSTAYINRVENGKQDPSLTSLKKFAQALEIPTNELPLDEEPPKDNLQK